jgi:hypothetical protein
LHASLPLDEELPEPLFGIDRLSVIIECEGGGDVRGLLPISLLFIGNRYLTLFILLLPSAVDGVSNR